MCFYIIYFQKERDIFAVLIKFSEKNVVNLNDVMEELKKNNIQYLRLKLYVLQLPLFKKHVIFI